MNRRKFFFTAGATGMTLASPAAAQAWIRRRHACCAPVPHPVMPAAGLPGNLSEPAMGLRDGPLFPCQVGFTSMTCNGATVTSENGQFTVTAPCTIVVLTTMPASGNQPCGRILRMFPMPPGMAEGEPLQQGSFWALRWVSYNTRGAGQILTMEDPQNPGDAPFELELHVL
jgi:hypothetical protein